MSLDEIADELYALPPRDFTAARNARAKEAREAGDSDLAKRITALGKPTMTGWLTNQLVRERPDEIRALLELGASLREATASLAGDELKELSRQQRQVVQALVRQARALADAAGHPATEDTARGLEQTLHAALADEAAAEQLNAGHLTGVLSPTGFPGDSGATPVTRATGARKGDVDEARQASEAAAAAYEDAQADLDEAGAALAEAAQRVDDVKRQLAEADEAHRAAQRAEREARATADKAARAARQAAQRLTNLQR
ncbi:hypothetical protein [Phytohabitans aurantiacus]|uniref:Transposase n=1 Tax=Phytohabitans aurantiacus TaxID=3016789 RepID=A0ABQ5RDD5_9ACTN|nr:hypothetical protein [Phytohabitans aurantiacus]GLI03927.1 hypothetical protein Pa4123_92080 [Phytohabitans aurantiacus]